MFRAITVEEARSKQRFMRLVYQYRAFEAIRVKKDTIRLSRVREKQNVHKCE